MKTNARVSSGQRLCAKQRFQSQRLYLNSDNAKMSKLLEGITPLLANRARAAAPGGQLLNYLDLPVAASC